MKIIDQIPLLFIFIFMPGLSYSASEGSGGNMTLMWECYTLDPYAPGSARTGCEMWSPNEAMYHIAVSVDLNLSWIFCDGSNGSSSPSVGAFLQTPYTNTPVRAAISQYFAAGSIIWGDSDITYAVGEWSPDSDLDPLFGNSKGPFTNSGGTCEF